MNRVVWCVLGALVTASLLGGCGKPKGTAVVPVSGTVTFDGKPIEGAVVMFVPVDKGETASGATDTQGKFTLNTASATTPGAVPGSYKVSVTKTSIGAKVAAPVMTQEESMKQAMEYVKGGFNKMGKKPEIKDELPAKYGSPDTSGLTAQVKDSGGNEFTFALTP